MLRGFATADVPALMEAVRHVTDAAPFRHMVTPGGHRMSVAMTNCGRAGWVTDRSGYRYDAIDPDDTPPVAGDAAAFRAVATPRRRGRRL